MSEYHTYASERAAWHTTVTIDGEEWPGVLLVPDPEYPAWQRVRLECGVVVYRRAA